MLTAFIFSVKIRKINRKGRVVIKVQIRIQNIGKIQEANVKFDGITIICGENNTGKSTVGKILFSCFNAMCNFEDKIQEQRRSEISEVLRKNVMLSRLRNPYSRSIREYYAFLESLDEKYNEEDLVEFWKTKYPDLKNTEIVAIAKETIEKMKISNEDLLNEYIYRYFSDVFCGQVKNIRGEERKSAVTITFREGHNEITFYANHCKTSQEVSIAHPAYYIDNPFVLDELNESRFYFMRGNSLNGNVVSAILNSAEEQADDKMIDIFDSVSNKEKLDCVREVLKKAYRGKTVLKNGLYFYQEGNVDFDFRNISTGLKSFALIERLLESGKLKQKDVLILDEPEIHLHPAWQLIYAEMIVVLQKEFDLTVLVTTHSPYFLEAIEVYTKKYEMKERANYYLSVNEDENCFMKDVTDNLEEIYKLMFNPMQKLEDMENGDY